jgi:hypothetical protein
MASKTGGVELRAEAEAAKDKPAAPAPRAK